LQSDIEFQKAAPKILSQRNQYLRRSHTKEKIRSGLLQREVAEKIGVDETTVYKWERQRTKPEIRFIARIIEFLGYDPLPCPKSFPERLKIRRRRMGLSPRRLASKLGINPSTLANLETGRQRPTKESRNLIDGFLGSR
jgi:transcriptional regulator with XRE-family HTH domain